MWCLQAVQNCKPLVFNFTCCVGTAYNSEDTCNMQCHCMSKGSMLSYSLHLQSEPVQKHNSSFHVGTTASTTAAWVHLRALRDTGSTCHGTPDLGEGSSGAHAFTCPWNAKRRRQDHRCMCMCAWEHVEGIPCPMETNRSSD